MDLIEAFQTLALAQLNELEHNMEHKYDLAEDHPLRTAIQNAKKDILIEDNCVQGEYIQ